MPAQPLPHVRDQEEEMEAAGESQLPEASGDIPPVIHPQHCNMDDSVEERDSDLEDTEEEESSEMDDEDCERRRVECLDEMMDLEKQFLELKEKLFRERLNQIKVKLDEVLTARAGEYREPVVVFQDNMHTRTQVAGVYRELCLQGIQHKHECELQGARQHWESERLLLFDMMKTELLEKIRRLEEDRQNLCTEWTEDTSSKKCKRKISVCRNRKNKVTLVSGPFIVYMLNELDILEDWTAIKKAKSALSSLKKKVEER